MTPKHTVFIEIEGLDGTLHINPNGTMFVTRHGIVDLIYPINVDDVVQWVDEHEVEGKVCDVVTEYYNQFGSTLE